VDDYDSGYDDEYGGRYDDSYGGGYDDGRYDDGGYVGRLVVYEHTGFAGRSRTYGGDAVNLAQDGWNDQISSFRVEGPGRWEICDDAYYGGRCQTFSSDVANLVELNWNDRISSLRYLP
jgi:hypothetical protein